MSLLQCENCGCRDNTALCCRGFTPPDFYDWSGIEDRKGKILCSACGPSRCSDGSDTEGGKWHGQFERIFLPKGKFKTNRSGNLEHVETGSENYREFALPQEEDLDGPRWRWLASVKCNSLSLARDDSHATNYTTAKKWIEEDFPEYFADCDPVELQRMKDTNTIWCLQIYPRTPVCFEVYLASTAERCIDAAMREYGKDAEKAQL